MSLLQVPKGTTRSKSLKEAEPKMIFYQPDTSSINKIVRKVLFKSNTQKIKAMGYCWYMALLNLCENIRTDIDKELELDGVSSARKKCWKSLCGILDIDSSERHAGNNSRIKPALDRKYAYGLIAINELVGFEYTNMIFKYNSRIFGCPSEHFKNKPVFQCDCKKKQKIVKRGDTLYTYNNKRLTPVVVDTKLAKQIKANFLEAGGKKNGLYPLPKGLQRCAYKQHTYTGTQKICVILDKLLGNADGDITGAIAYTTLAEVNDGKLQKLKAECELLAITAGYGRNEDNVLHQVAWIPDCDDEYKLYDSAASHPQKPDGDGEAIGGKHRRRSRETLERLSVVIGRERARSMQGFQKPTDWSDVRWHLRHPKTTLLIYRRGPTNI